MFIRRLEKRKRPRLFKSLALEPLESRYLLSGRSINTSQVVEDGKYPWMVSLGRHDCAGTLIAPDLVATTATCTSGIPEIRTVKIGDFPRQSNEGDVVEVRRVTQHPEFDRKRPEFDIAIIELAELSDQPTVPFAGKEDARLIGPQAASIAIGWETSTYVRLGNALLESRTGIGSSDELPSSVTLADSQLYTQTMPCDISSGGPLMTTDYQGGYVQTGIIQSAPNCSSSQRVTTYANVIWFDDFVSQFLPSSHGTVRLSSHVSPGDDLNVVVRDSDLPTSRNVHVELTNGHGDQETIALTHVANGVFQGTIETTSDSTEPGDAQLTIAVNDQVNVTYTDARHGDGAAIASVVDAVQVVQDDHSDDLGGARPIALGSTIEATLSPHDVDWFSFDIEYPTIVTLAATSATEGTNGPPLLHAMDSMGRPLSSRISSDGELRFDIAEPGTHFLRVSNLALTTPTNYSLELNVLDEIGQIPSSAFSVRDVIHAGLETVDDEDLFRMELVAGQAVDATSVARFEDLRIEVLASDAETVVALAQSSAANSPFPIQFVPQQPGTYFLRVSSTTGATGGYHIRFSNLRLPTAISIQDGETITAKSEKDRLTQRFAFDVDKASTAVLRFEPISIDAVSFSLVTPIGQEPEPPFFRLSTSSTQRFVEPGRYFVELQGATEFTHGTYQARLELLPAETVEIGQTLESHIETPTGHKWFELDLDHPRSVQIETQGDNRWVGATIYQSGAVIPFDDQFDIPLGVQRSYYRLPAGKYFLSVLDYCSEDYCSSSHWPQTPVGDFHVLVSIQDDHANDPVAATVLHAEGVHLGTIDTALDEDWFRVYATHGDRLAVELLSQPADAATVRLYTSDSDDDGTLRLLHTGTTNGPIVQTATEADWYFLQVTSPFPSEYQLSIHGNSGYSSPVSLRPDHPLTGSTETTITSIRQGGCETTDYLTFEVHVPTQVSIETSRLNGCHERRLSVLDPDMERLQANASSGDYHLVRPGKYTIQIRGEANNPLGTYEAVIKTRSAVPLTLNQITQGAPLGTDVYSITTQETKTLTVRTNLDNSKRRWNLTLYDAAWNQIVARGDQQIAFTFLPETYFLVVKDSWHRDANTIEAPYEIEISDRTIQGPPWEWQSIHLGETLDVTVDASDGYRQLFSFEIDEPLSVQFDARASEQQWPDGEVELLGPDGTTILDNRWFGDTTVAAPRLQPGRYFFRVWVSDIGINYQVSLTLSVLHDANQTAQGATHYRAGKHHGSFYSPSDVDRFYFHATGNDFITIRLTPEDEVRPRLRVYAANGADLLAEEQTDGMITVLFTAPQTGEYYVVVDLQPGHEFAKTPYELFLSGMSSMVAVDLRTAMEDQLRHNETAWYFIDVESPKSILVDVESVSLGPHRIELLDIHQTQLASNESSDNTDGTQVRYELPTPGRYFIKIHPRQPSDFGTYRLRVATNDQHADELQHARQIRPGKTRGALNAPNDIDWLAFSVAAETTVRIESHFATVEGLSVTIRDATGKPLAARDDLNDVVWFAENTGTYFVEIKSESHGIGHYDLDITGVLDSTIRLLGDINRDNTVDPIDLSLMCTGQRDEHYILTDLNFDNRRDIQDVTLLLNQTDIRFGDANFDGQVNKTDLDMMAAHWHGSQQAKTWRDGDFDCDGKVDSRDLNLLATNYNRVNTLTRRDQVRIQRRLQ